MRRAATIWVVVAALIGAALPAVASASPEGFVPVEGPWSGRTSDELPVTFEVREGSVREAHFTFQWGFCGDFSSELVNSTPIDSEGHWKFLDGRGPYIEGTFVNPERMEGTVNAPSRELPGCPKTVATIVAAPGSTLPPRRPVRVTDGEGRRVAHPKTFYLDNERTLYFYGLEWHGLGRSVAHATGRAYVRRGCGRCPGHLLRPRVTLRLTQPQVRGEYRTYSRLHWKLKGDLPQGVRRSGSVSL